MLAIPVSVLYRSITYRSESKIFFVKKEREVFSAYTVNWAIFITCTASIWNAMLIVLQNESKRKTLLSMIRCYRKRTIEHSMIVSVSVK